MEVSLMSVVRARARVYVFVCGLERIFCRMGAEFPNDLKGIWSIKLKEHYA
jgi:hypothetical protein